MSEELPQDQFTEKEFRKLIPGIAKGVGWWRLSIVLASLPSATLAALLIFDGQAVFWRGAIMVAVAFLVPWFLVQVIGWVVEGFKSN
jgi:hypothetical protein